MSHTLSLHQMVRNVIDGAKEKIAGDEAAIRPDSKVGKLLKYEKKEHGHVPSPSEEEAESEKMASEFDPEYVEKLASACDYIAENLGDIEPSGPISQALSKMAETGSPVGSGKGGGALPQNKPTPGHQSYKKDHPHGEDAAASQAGTAMSTGDNGKGKTQLENNMHKAPGQHSGRVPTAQYPAKGPLVNNGKTKTASEAATEHILLTLANGEDLEKDAGLAATMARPAMAAAAKPAAQVAGAAAKKVLPGAAHAAGAAAKPLGTAVGGGAVPAGHWGAWANKMAQKKKQAGMAGIMARPALAGAARPAAAAAAGAAKKVVPGAAHAAAAAAKPLGTAVGGGAAPAGRWDWANKLAGEDVSKANISAKGGSNPMAGKGQLESFDASKAPPKASGGPTSGFGNEGRKHLSSIGAAIDLNKHEAKAPVKTQLKQVLEQPALTRKTDNKVHENLRNADKGGVKIAAVRGYMAKIAAGGCTCGGKGECEFDLLKEAAERARGEKVATMGMGSSAGSMSGPGMGGGMGAMAGGEVGPDGCTCGEAGECRVCQLKAELAAAQAEALGGEAPVPGAEVATGGAPPAGAGAVGPMGMGQ